MVKPAEVDDLRRGGVFKYVRLSDDTFRFVEYGNYTPEHRELVSAAEVAKSGGAVETFDGQAKVVMRGSMTLRVPTLEDDESRISALLFPV